MKSFFNVASNLIIIFSLLLWPISFLYTGGINFPQNTSTIFVVDWQARQQVIRNTYLYPNVFLSRAFQNKLTIPTKKFLHNFMSLIDPTNYFFSSHPREQEYNQNLSKYPFVIIVFLLYGLIKIKSLFCYKFLGKIFLVLIFFLSILEHFDRYDIVLWPLISYVSYYGSVQLKKDSYRKYALTVILLAFIVPIEYLRLFLIL